MPLSEPHYLWSDLIKMLRTEVRRARMTNWRSLAKNSNEYIDGALYYVRRSPEIDQASKKPRQMCSQFANHIAECGLRYSPDNPVGKQARELALIAVDELQEVLKDAKPSDEAASLGG